VRKKLDPACPPSSQKAQPSRANSPRPRHLQDKRLGASALYITHLTAQRVRPAHQQQTSSRHIRFFPGIRTDLGHLALGHIRKPLIFPGPPDLRSMWVSAVAPMAGRYSPSRPAGCLVRRMDRPPVPAPALKFNPFLRPPPFERLPTGTTSWSIVTIPAGSVAISVLGRVGQASARACDQRPKTAPPTANILEGSFGPQAGLC